MVGLGFGAAMDDWVSVLMGLQLGQELDSDFGFVSNVWKNFGWALVDFGLNMSLKN